MTFLKDKLHENLIVLNHTFQKCSRHTEIEKRKKLLFQSVQTSKDLMQERDVEGFIEIIQIWISFWMMNHILP